VTRAIAAVLAAMALAGCGGGVDEDYEEAVNSYFSQEIAATEAYEAEAEQADDLEEFADVLEEGLAGSERRLAAFKAEADAPDEVRDVHEDLVATVEQELRLGDEYVSAARAGDEDRIDALDAELEPVLARFPELQRRLGDAGYDVELPAP
jgi:hypothetical protein